MHGDRARASGTNDTSTFIVTCEGRGVVARESVRLATCSAHRNRICVLLLSYNKHTYVLRANCNIYSMCICHVSLASQSNVDFTIVAQFSKNDPEILAF